AQPRARRAREPSPTGLGCTARVRTAARGGDVRSEAVRAPALRVPSLGSRAVSLLPPLALIAALLGAWELYVDAGSTSSYVLPAPHAVAAAIWNNAGLLWANLGPTATEIGLGITLALLLGFVLAVLIHLSSVA